MRTVLGLVCALLVPTLAWAQAETLQLTFETSATGDSGGADDFRPSNVVVVWLARSDGAHVATLARWGVAFAHNLRAWVGDSEFGSDGSNQDGSKPVDGLTEASQRCYTGDVFDLDDSNADGCGYLSTCTTCTLENMPALLDTGAVDISGIPDGNYTIEIELSDWEIPNVSHNGRASIPFTKPVAGTAGAWTPADVSTFSNISVTYTGRPGPNYPPGVYAGPDIWITPTTVATANIVGEVTDADALTISWSVIDPPGASSCVTFVPADQATTDVSFCRDGIYVLGLTANDGSLSTRDELVVYVNAQAVNPVADSFVQSGDVNNNNGIWRFMWNSNDNRAYLRFDLTAITDTITAARFQCHGVESIYTDNDRVLRLIQNDAWNETAITYSNQPLTNNDYSLGVTAASFLPEFGINRADLDPAVLQHAWFTDLTASFFLGPEASNAEWMGLTSRETYAPPQLVVVTAWLENNSAPTAVASVPALAIADAAGTASVSLDGSGSSDPDSNIVRWEWNEVGNPGNPIATGATATADLGLGFHSLDLRVVDSMGEENTDSGHALLVDDRYAAAPDPNDAAARAEVLTGGTHDNLFAHDTAGDWFLVTLSADGGLDVDIAFAHADGDLNLEVLESDGTTLVDQAQTATDDESLSITGLSAGDFLVHVSAASGDAVYSMTIAVTGAPELRVSFSQTEVLEGAAPADLLDIGTVALFLDGNPSTAAGDVAVTLSSNQSDLSPESPVTIADGQGSVTFDITMTDNAIEESDRTATVTATATAHTAGAGDILIRDDDGPLPIVSWATATQTVSETAATATITLTMTATSLADVVVPFTLSGTATAGGVDYQVGSTSITVASGNTSADLTFVLVDDSGAEGDETAIFTIGTPVGATSTLPTIHLVTIADDETVTTDGGPRPDGGTGDVSGDGSVTGDSNGEVPSEIILEGTGCACGQTGSPAAAALLLLAVAWRRRATRLR